MNRLLLAGAIVLLSGCVAPTQPQTAVQPAPRLSPPRILHRLVLTSPQGQGVLELRREARWQDGMETMTDTASGAIVVTDDVGNWRFAYTKTSLEGVGLAPEEWLVGLHALSVILTNTSGDDVDIDSDHPPRRAAESAHRPDAPDARPRRRNPQRVHIPRGWSALRCASRTSESLACAGGLRASGTGFRVLDRAGRQAWRDPSPANVRVFRRRPIARMSLLAEEVPGVFIERGSPSAPSPRAAR